MQKGFLSGGAKARGGGGGNAAAASAATATEGEAEPMPSPSPPPPPPPEPPAPSSRSREDCLDLLRGPTDERRLVGLLLATRVLPRGDAAALSAAREAIGDAFLARLLLPLDDCAGSEAQKRSEAFQPSSSSSTDPERTLREAGQISLSLAVSSAFAGGLGIAVAGSDAFLSLAPRWCKVVAARGAVAALGGLPQAAAAVAVSSSSFNSESEAAATRDALDCLLAAALSGPMGRAAAAAAGGAAAAARALAGVDTSSLLPQWLGRAARLLALLLPAQKEEEDGPKKRGRAASVAAAGDLAAAAPALAALLSPPPEALLAGAAAAAAANASGISPPGSDAASDQLDALSAFDALASRLNDDEGEGGEEASRDRAALALSAAATSSFSAASWPVTARAGLAGLLRARAGPAVRHAALRVSAFVASLVSEGSGGRASWLLLPPPATTNKGGSKPKNRSDAADASAPEFLRVLSEVCRVEAALLFRDAEDGDALVAAPEASAMGFGSGSGGGGAAAAAAAAAAATSASAPPDNDDDVDDADDDSSLKPPPRLNVTDGDLDAAAGRWHEKKAGGGGGGGGGAAERKEQQEEREEREEARRRLEPAARRAERTLPSVLSLVEAALDALANDAEAGERRARERRKGGGGAGAGGGGRGGMDAELDEILGGGRGLGGEGGDGGDGADSSGELFPDDVAVRAFSSLKDAVEQGLDYLEGRAPGLALSQQQQQQQQQRHSSSAPPPPPPPLSPSERAARSLAPAAARCLGRLLADAPAAFGARPRALLPALLRLRCGSEEAGRNGTTCGRFFLPVLSGALLADGGDGGGEGGEGAETNEEMMAALSLDDGDAGAWLSAARRPEALSGLAETLAAACWDAVAAAAAGGAGGAENGGGADGDGEVAAAAAVLTGLLPRPCPSYVPLGPVLVPALSSWAASRLGRGRKSERENGGEREKKPQRKRAGGDGATASILSTANEAARALALLLASSSSPPPNPSGDDLPPSSAAAAAAAAASSAALVACLRPGWLAWTLRSKRKERKQKRREEEHTRGGGDGVEDELEQQQHRNDFGPSAAPMEDASHLALEVNDGPSSMMLVEKLRQEVEAGEEAGDGFEGFELDGGHGERGWRRALRAAALVAEADSSGAALVAAASSAPWLRELLEGAGEDEEEVSAASALALRAFVGALRKRLMKSQ